MLRSNRTSRATVAAYFLYGIETGILSPEQAKAWAFSIVESRDEPPYDIIDIAQSCSLVRLLATLSAAKKDGDTQLAGRWLLAVLNRNLQADPAQFRTILMKAMQVVLATGLGDDVYSTFDCIDDSLHLVESETYGSVDACRADLAEALAQYTESVELDAP